MKKLNITAVLLLSTLLLLCLAMISCKYNKSGENGEISAPEVHEDVAENGCTAIEITGEPTNLYSVYTGTNTGYRYGASLMLSADGRIDAWYSSLGAFGQADFITHNSSVDNAATWSVEDCALQPTPSSQDGFSCCDPGCVKFGGYYYVAYTSTIDTEGYCNSAFIARSTEPDGEYEKWCGSYWGYDNPVPFIRWDGNGTMWGIGEVSFVVLDNELYIYYTQRGSEGESAMLAKADINNENWPSEITYIGRAIAMEKLESGIEFRYCEQYECFIAVSAVSVRTEDSYIIVYESKDGINFDITAKITEGIYAYAHNPGLSGDEYGHIKIGDPIYLTYAYGDKWGFWSTALQRIEIVRCMKADTNDFDNKIKSEIVKPKKVEQPVSFIPSIVTTNPHIINTYICSGNFLLDVYEINSVYKYRRTVNEVLAVEYDASVVTIEDGIVTPTGVGETLVRINSGTESCLVLIRVYSDRAEMQSSAVVSFEPYEEMITVSKAITHGYQIRGIIRLKNGTWGEAYNRTDENALFPKNKYEIKYKADDVSVLTVADNGVIIPKKEGVTTVTATLNGKMSFTVTVNITK